MFKNKSVLGAFGEFAYKNFCDAQGFFCERTNYCHTDFWIAEKNAGEKIYVDVKSSESRHDGYRGKRFRLDIVYESILIQDGVVKLIPDVNSPFRKFGEYELGTFDELQRQWISRPKIGSRNRRLLCDQEFLELNAVFAKSKFPRMRLVERGDASAKRWTGTVDNLPGQPLVIERADATLFIQYGCLDFRQIVSSLMLFPHELIKNGSIKMSIPNERQRKKGIVRVIDLSKFKEDFPHLLFSNIDDLKIFLSTQ